MMHKCLLSSAVACAFALTGCAVSFGSSGVDDFGERRQREWDELNAQKAELAWNAAGPIRFDFPSGRVTVRSWYLEGGPGWEYVRARFTYENTTNRAFERIDVRLVVMDAKGEMVAGSQVRLTHPWGHPLMPGTLFSDEVAAPTVGQHRDPRGWEWRLDLVPLVYEGVRRGEVAVF